MRVGLRFWWSLLFALGVLLCSAASRNTILVPGNEKMVVVGGGTGRSLKLQTDDYDDPSANKGHDPKNKGGGDSGRN
ncbi:hypothetical protein IFM89_011267 [Coptis chinensis]|uniref:Uncharacterized protein n=1 Tax=Coptis chinensis TaxID=261450 RepID=A0A835LI48_9MAGN|nr:hypothetical protein IFM89_011267 [Coptis chinensis]